MADTREATGAKMNSFFRELKERKVYRVALGYAVVAWLVIQISATVMPVYHAPEPRSDLAATNKRRVWLLAAVGLIISTLAVGGYWIWHPWRNASTAKSMTASTTSESSTVTTPAIQEKSVAV